MFTLALDCSTARGSVALGTAGGEIVFQVEFTAGRGHGGELFAALRRALGDLAAARCPPAAAAPALAEIVVGLGPGSYSGTRQAIAAAAGLARAAGARLSGLPSPVALETNATAWQAVGDGRRGTFYYTAVENGVCIVGPELVPTRGALDERLAMFPASWPILAVETAPALVPPAAQPALPLARRLLIVPGASRTLPPLEPIYLRGPAFTLPAGKQ